MTQNFRSFALLSLCGLSACTNLSAVDSAVDRAQPESLRPPDDAWTRVVSTRIAARSRALRRADDGSFVAAMPMSSATARLSADGVTLSSDAALELRLAAFGRDDALQPLGSAEPVEGDCVSENELDPEGDCVRAIERQHPGLTEWWVGLDDGVEQGFTLAERPEGEGELRIDVAVDGALGLDTDGETAWLYDGAGAAWTVSELAAWDADGEPLPVRFEGDGDTLRVLVDDAGAVYPVVVDPVYSSYTALNSCGATAGFSVAGLGDLNGDGYDDVAVGSPGLISTSTSISGRVYLFAGSASGVATTASATLIDSSVGNLGYSIAGNLDLDGDSALDVVVGAPNSSTANGSVLVFWGVSGSWPTTASGGYTTLQGPSAGSAFGTSVASLGDVNGDGLDDLAVGAPGYSSSRGMVKIHYGTTNRSRLNYSSNVGILYGSSSGDQFGVTLAGAGDTNGDGYMDLIVGAPGHSNGQAQIFIGSASGLPSSASVSLSAPSSRSDYAESVAGLQDVNGDGYDDVSVSAPGYNGNHGVVYVYMGGSGGTSSTYNRLSSANNATRSYGHAVAGVGDLNADGYDDFAIGATDYLAGSGDVEVYHGGAGTLSANAADSLTSSSAALGFSLAGAGDVNGDGYADLLIGVQDSISGEARVYYGYRDDDRDGVAFEDDCDDSDASVGLAGTRYRDNDGDGYGYVRDARTLCPDVAGYVSNHTDCDDSSASINPAATEIVADEIDENCDGYEMCHADHDEDGYGSAQDLVRSADMACDLPGESYGGGQADCDDHEATVHPNAEESIADGIDQDCDGLELCYTDADFDGFRAETTLASASLSCDEPGFATAEDAAGDCDDDDGAVYPGASDTAGDGIDGDCDGQELCFVDADSDGFRPDGGATVQSDDGDCADPGEAVASAPVGDCDDASPTAHPGAEERAGDGIDGDCDGQELCFLDEDGDGFTGGDLVSSAQLSCADVAGLDLQDGDCDDELAVISPAATEEPGDGIDQDCDGSDSEADGQGGEDSGCGGCSASGGAPSASLLSLFGLLLMRRRR